MDHVEYSLKQIEEESVKKLVNWKNPPTVKDLEKDYINAEQYRQKIISKIDNWLKLYEAKNISYGKNRSRTRPKIIKKMAKWTYPIIEEPLLAKKDLFELEPRTHEDYKTSFLNKIILNQQFREEMDFIKFLNNATRIYVNQGTLIVKIGWNRKYEKIKKIEPVFSIVPILDQNGQPQLDQNGQIMTEKQKVGSKVVEIEEMTKNHPILEPCDYKKITIDPTANGDINKAQFIVYEYETNLSNLKKENKYKNLDLVDLEKSLTEQDSNKYENFNFKDDPRKVLSVKEYWGYWDINSDGKTVPIVATYIGKVMIGLESNPLPFNELPFEMCHFEPVFGSNFGEPDAEIIAENQENIGAMTRSIIDIFGRSAAAQEGRPKDFLDPVNKRKYDNGEDYEYNPMINPKDAFYMHTPPEIGNSIFNMIDMQSKEAEEMVGKKPFALGNSQSALNATATAIRTTLDATTKRELGILRRFVSMLERCAKKIISMNRMYLTDGQIFKITNDKFLAINRDQLYGKFDVKLKVSTPEENEMKIQKWSFMLQTLGQKMPFYITKNLMAKIADYSNDPEVAEMLRKYEPQPDPLEQERQKLEIELLKRQIAVYDSSVKENMADALLKTKKAEEIDANIDLKDLEFIDKAEGISHIQELEKQAQITNEKLVLEDLKAQIIDIRNRNKSN